MPRVARMPRVTLMGAGSAVFSRQLMTDILLIPDLDGGSFALVDIDPVRLEMAHQLAEKVIALADDRDVRAGLHVRAQRGEFHEGALVDPAGHEDAERFDPGGEGGLDIQLAVEQRLGLIDRILIPGSAEQVLHRC